MGWEFSTKKTSDVNAKSAAENLMQNRTVEKVAAGNMNSSIMGDTIVGINLRKVGPAIDAIDTYIQAIENYIEENVQVDTESRIKAYKGTLVKDAVVAYLTKVKTYCINLVSQLRAFEDKLNAAQQAWADSTKNMAEVIEAQAANINEGEHEEKREAIASSDLWEEAN